MKTGDKRFNEDEFVAEVFVVDRWLIMETIVDMKRIDPQGLFEMLEIEFGDKWPEARDFLELYK